VKLEQLPQGDALDRTETLAVVVVEELLGLLRARNDSPAPETARIVRLFPLLLPEAKPTWGAQFRRLRTRLGAPTAIKAMPSWPACSTRKLRDGMKYVDQRTAFYELRHRELEIIRLKAKTEKLGYRVTPIPAAA
jgi:hypothetical protein